MNDHEAPLRIDSAERWKVVSSPVRFDILVQLERLGSSSIALLAEQMGRPADSLYHHVRQLLSVGLICQEGQQQPGRNPEAVYRLAGAPLLFDFDPQTGRNVEEAISFGNALFRAAARAHERSLRHGQLQLESGPSKDLHLRHESARLGATEVARLNALFGEIVALLDSAPTDPNAPVYTLTWSLSPEPRHHKSE